MLFCVLCFAAMDDHGGHRGYMVHVLSQWQRPVALREALVMLHWAMHTTLHRRMCVAIKTSSKPCVFYSLSTR
jgi:hypothetical protein